jgi:hypothetical protein
MQRVFISYSWESPEHIAWVRQLATDLKARGLDVWFDKWEIKLGDNILKSMEAGLLEADYVLLVCTEDFADKANARTGGVGYEQAIVSTEILNSRPARGSFVCILRSGKPSVAIPLFMQSRLFLDMTRDEDYKSALDELTTHLLKSSELLLASNVRASALQNAMLNQPAPAAVKPRAWVLVAGTGIPRKFTSELKALAQYLGTRLAADGFGLVTGGWPGVDETVARAFEAGVSGRNLALEDLLIQTIVDGKEPNFPAGQLVFKKRSDYWDASVARSDAIVLLGGVGGTGTIGKVGLAAHKPVFPVADTGGDAKALYLAMIKDWTKLGWMNLSQKDFSKVARSGRGGVDGTLDLLKGIWP